MRRKVWNSEETVEREDVDAFLAEYGYMCAKFGMCLDWAPENEWEDCGTFTVREFGPDTVRFAVVEAEIHPELLPAPAPSQASDPAP